MIPGRPTRQLDPVTIALAFLIASLGISIFSLWEVSREVRKRRRLLGDARGANTVLAAHTRRLAGELFDSQVDLQQLLATETGHGDDFWDPPPADGLAGAALAASEGTSQVPGRASEPPCEDCPE